MIIHITFHFNISKLKTSINRVTFEKPTTGIQLYIIAVIFLYNLENYVLYVAPVFLISIHHHKYENMALFRVYSIRTISRQFKILLYTLVFWSQ